MKYVVILLFFIGISFCNAENNYPFISHKSEEKILDYYLSPDGSKVVYAYEIDNGFKLTCLESKDCSKIWERDIYMDNENLLPLFKFVTENVFYAIDSCKHVYLNAQNGKTTNSLPLFTDKISKVVNSKDVAAVEEVMEHTYCADSLMLIFGKPGMQILDHLSQKILYESKGGSGYVMTKINMDDDWIFASKDSIFVFDPEAKQMVLCEELDNLDLCKRFKKNIIHCVGQIILLCDNRVIMRNLKKNLKLELFEDPTDYEYSTQFLIGDELYFCATNENGIHQVYNVNTCKKEMEISNKVLPGIPENIIFTPDNTKAVFCMYDNDEDHMYVASVEKATGNLLAKKALFEYHNNFNTNYKNQSAASAFFTGFIANTALAVVTGQIGNSNSIGFRISIGSKDYERTPVLVRSDMENVKKDKFNNQFKKMIISDGYSSLLQLTNDKVAFLCFGDIETLCKPGKDPKKDVAEEFFTVLNVATMDVEKYKTVKFAPEPQNSNAIQYCNAKYIKGHKALFSSNSVAFYKNFDINISNYDCSDMQYLDTDFESLFIVYRNKSDKYYSLRRYKLTEDKIATSVVYKSYYKTMPDYNTFYGFNSTILMTDDSLLVLPLQTEEFDYETVACPRKGESFSKLKFDGFINPKNGQNIAGFFQGISIFDNYILLASEDNISLMNKDCSCNWNMKWNPSEKSIRLPIQYIGSTLLTAGNGQTVAFDISCKPTQLLVNDDCDNLKYTASGKLFVNQYDKKNIRIYKIK